MAARWTKESFEEQIQSTEHLILADFYSDFCVPCKKLSPILGDLEDQYGDQLTVGKINVSYETELAHEYEVKATPTLLFIRNGQVADRLEGAVKKAELEEKIKRYV